MLQPKEVDKLIQIINTNEQSLEQIEGQFLVTFNENLHVFKASYTLSHLLNHNLLTLQQRIVALFLLIENYKSQGIKKHPFGATILNISQKTSEGFQRRMISDLILDAKREKYSKIKVEELFDEEQLMVELFPQRPQIKKLRAQFIAQLPNISQSKNSQLFNRVPEFSHRNKTSQPPEQFSRNSVKEKQLSKSTFNIGRMRPIPQFIDINPFQMSWISPGVVTDVHWDNTVEIDKKFVKIKGIIKKGLQSKLTKEQSTQIERCLENQPYAVLNLDLTPQNLILLINNNPYVAVSFLVKVGNYPIVGDYLQSLLDCNISLNCIDVVIRLLKVLRIPVEFIEAFALKNLKESQDIAQNKDRAKLGRVITKFIISLTKNDLMDITPISQDIIAFCKFFKDIQEAQFLEKLANMNKDQGWSQ